MDINYEEIVQKLTEHELSINNSLTYPGFLADILPSNPNPLIQELFDWVQLLKTLVVLQQDRLGKLESSYDDVKHDLNALYDLFGISNKI